MTFRFDGLREVKANLDQLKKSTARGVLERALKKAAAPVERRAKSDAPVDTGELKRSIGTRVIRTSAGKAAFAAAMRSGNSRADAAVAARAANRAAAGQGASAVVRVEATAPHAHFVEFGTVNQPPAPFMSPALRISKNEILANITTEIKSELTKTAARLAKRKAKQ